MPSYTLDIIANGEDNASGMLHGLGGSFGSLSTIATGALLHIGSLAVDTALKVGGALVDQGVAALKAAGEYQQNLDVFQSVTGATGDQMEQLRATAKALGADMDLPGTSAAGAAAAMLELGKAGLSVDSVLAAAKGTLQLSAAGVRDNARAAEITANALMAFGLEGSKATMVADQLAAVANKSSVEVTDVADSMKMASSVFSAFQGPVVGAETAMTQLNAAIGLLGNVGIKGSDAGTSLKQMLLQLTGPSQVAKDQMKALMYAAQGTGDMFGRGSDGVAELTKALQGNGTARSEALKSLAIINPAAKNMGDIAYDASGKMRAFPEIIDLVTKATKSMSDEQRNAAITSIFGADASRAVIALMQAGPAAFNDMTGAITRQGAAGEAAAAMNKGLLGALDGLQSVWETLQLALAEPLLEPIAAGIRSIAGAVDSAQPTLLAFVTAYIVPAAQGLAGFLDGFVQAPDKIGFLQTAFGNAVSYIATALPGWLAGLGQWSLAAATWILNAIPGLLSNADTMSGSLLDAIGRAVPAIVTALGGWGASFVAWILPALPGMLDRLLAVVSGIGGWIAERVPIIGGFLAGWVESFASWAGEIWPRLSPTLIGMLDKVVDWLLDVLPVYYTNLAKWGMAFVGFIAPYIPKVLVALGELWADVAAWIIGKQPEIWAKVAVWGAAFSEWVKTEAWPKLQTNLGVMWNDLSTWISQKVAAAQADGSIGRALVDGIKFGINAAWSGFTGWMATQWNDFIRGVKYVLGVNSPSTVFAEIGGYLMDGLRNGLNDAWGRVTGLASDIGMSIKDKLREWFGAFQDTGSYLVQGLWQGIQNSWQSTLVGPLRDLASQLPEPIRRALGIASPSKLFGAEIGRWLLPGVVEGAEATLPQAGRDLGQLAGQLPGLAMPSLSLPTSAAVGSSAGGSGTITNVYVTVQGSVVTERDLLTGILDGLRTDSRQNGGLTAMGVVL